MQKEKQKFESLITKEWYTKAAEFVSSKGTDYAWIWDYAKFRFNWACGNGRYIEEKAMTLFKFLLAIVAFIGASISFLVAHGVTLTRWSYVCSLLTIAALLASALSLLKTFDPSDHLYPIDEEAALICSRGGILSDCRANMSLALAASTEFERHAINKKARWLRVGLGAACASIILFILSLFFQVHP